MKNKKRHILLLSLLLSTIGFICGSILYLYNYTSSSNKTEPNLSDPNHFIAHATGSLDGYTYLNCLESLTATLENGYKYIEIDLQYTSDSVLVCVHDWEQFNKATIKGISGKDTNEYTRIPTVEEFKQRKIYGKYTPLTLDDIIKIQEKKSFIIVTDFICDVHALNKYFIKNRRKGVMVEAFSEKDYKLLNDAGYTAMLSIGRVNHFECLYFICSHISKNNVRWITVEQNSSKRSLRLLKKILGIKIALYTVNSSNFFKWYLESHVDLIYTDNWNLKTQINNYQDLSTF